MPSSSVISSLPLDAVLLGDNCERLAQFPPESVDLVVTSPPYDDLRTYGGHSWDFERLAGELTRVLKPGGVIVWVVADATINGSETLTSMRQAIHFKDVCGLNVHDTMVYAKKNPMPKNDRRCTPAWEYMFVLSAGSPARWNPPMDQTKEPGKLYRTSRQFSVGGELKEKWGNANATAESKVRRNVWEYATGGHLEDKTHHAAQMPEQLAKECVNTWSNPGDVVLDPFAGSGTTLKAAKELGRRFVGIEINPEYVDICQRRIAQEVLALDFRPPCPRCGYCGFIEDADMNLAGVCPECSGAGYLKSKRIADETADETSGRSAYNA